MYVCMYILEAFYFFYGILLEVQVHVCIYLKPSISSAPYYYYYCKCMYVCISFEAFYFWCEHCIYWKAFYFDMMDGWENFS